MERAFQEGEMDPFPFTLAEQLGMTVESMLKSMSNPEYLAWRAFYVWRAAKREFGAKRAR
jgi:hypothetical protein